MWREIWGEEMRRIGENVRRYGREEFLMYLYNIRRREIALQWKNFEMPSISNASNIDCLGSRHGEYSLRKFGGILSLILARIDGGNGRR